MLKEIYELRALSTEQLARMFGYSIQHMYRLTQRLRSENYIITESIKGYIPNKKRQGDYHRIAMKGINFLRERNYMATNTADSLRVSTSYLPYVLSVNDLYIDLKPFGWNVMGSRDVKDYFYLNPGDTIHGMLSKKESRYPFYVFINKSKAKTLKRIKNEIERYNFSDMIFFSKSADGFYQIIEEFYDHLSIVKYRTFRVFPYTFGKQYLIAFNNPANLMNYMSSKHGIEVVYDIDPNRNHYGLDTVVRHEGEKKYFVNMLDNDMKKLHIVNNYRKERYEADGKKVLLVTNMGNLYRDLLKNIHHVEFLDIGRDELSSYFRTVL